MFKRRYLVFLLVLFSAISLFLGITTVNLQGLLYFKGNQWQIFLDSRVPRLVSILIAGASLSICGLVMQQLSRNRFVSPTTAGTMDSARLGDSIFLWCLHAAENHYRGTGVFPWLAVIYDAPIPPEIQKYDFCTFSRDDVRQYH